MENESHSQSPVPIDVPPAPGTENLPPCAPIADTGGIGLLPFPRVFVPRGSPFRVAPINYLYLSSRANENVRKKYRIFTERLAASGVRVMLNSSTTLAPLQAVFTDSAQFPKWVKMDPQMRGDVARIGGYRIVVNQDCIIAQGADEIGVQNASSTLLQLIEDGPDVPGMEIDDYPVLPYRAVHVDCKGWPPSIDWLRRAIPMLASVKVNVLILEYDTHFSYASSPEITSEGILTSKDIQELDTFARDCGVSLVPLVSCLGSASSVLIHPEFAVLREHSDYPHMYCAASPEVQNFLSSRIGELLQVHADKIVHLGGDGAFLLGSNPVTLQRAEELGGLDGVYLEHIGAMCRYVVSQGAQPLINDEMLREMSDAQIKWLPQEAAIVLHLPGGLTPDVSDEVLGHLERYKVMKRSVWCNPVVSPARGYDAFDNLDAWGEVGDLGYISGMIATVRTREFSGQGLLPPFDIAWPTVFYAAERAWGGKQVIARDLFPQRFIMRFFGLHNNLEMQSRLWTGIDQLLLGQYATASLYLKAGMAPVSRNAEVLALMENWCAVNAFIAIHQELETELRSNFSNIQNGSADVLFTGRLRWQVQALKARASAIISGFTQAALPFANDLSVHEYIESALAYTLRRLDELEPILEAYPIPPEEMRGEAGI